MINLIVASSFFLLREGLKSIFSPHKELRVAGEVSYMEDALAAHALVKNCVTVIVSPLICRNQAETFSLASEWKSRRLIAITLGKDIADVQAALQIGARGILSRTCPQDHILQAVRVVASDELYVSQEMALLIAANAKSFSGVNSLTRLTERELEILKRIAIGRRMSTIGAELNISVKTVSSHKSNILEKLSLNSDSELVLYAMKNDLFDLFVDHAKRNKKVLSKTRVKTVQMPDGKAGCP
jgi:DNA-binding NarL/FixJ family response regulator